MTDSLTAFVKQLNLQGWYRWGGWSAHHFVDGVQRCKIAHHRAKLGVARGLAMAAPTSADLSRHGEPYGRVCQVCLRAVRKDRK